MYGPPYCGSLAFLKFVMPFSYLLYNNAYLHYVWKISICFTDEQKQLKFFYVKRVISLNLCDLLQTSDFLCCFTFQVLAYFQ